MAEISTPAFDLAVAELEELVAGPLSAELAQDLAGAKVPAAEARAFFFMEETAHLMTHLSTAAILYPGTMVWRLHAIGRLSTKIIQYKLPNDLDRA
jgi:hypothetical protein